MGTEEDAVKTMSESMGARGLQFHYLPGERITLSSMAARVLRFALCGGRRVARPASC